MVEGLVVCMVLFGSSLYKVLRCKEFVMWDLLLVM